MRQQQSCVQADQKLAGKGDQHGWKKLHWKSWKQVFSSWPCVSVERPAQTSQTRVDAPPPLPWPTTWMSSTAGLSGNPHPSHPTSRQRQQPLSPLWHPLADATEPCEPKPPPQRSSYFPAAIALIHSPIATDSYYILLCAVQKLVYHSFIPIHVAH